MTTTGTSADKADDFYLKEYEALRREIEWLLKDYRELERNVVIAVGLTWAWLFERTPPKPAWLIPILFAGLGAWRAYGITESFDHYHEYICHIEDAFSRPGDPGGWEHTKWHGSGGAKGAFLFWLSLIVVTVIAAIYGFVPMLFHGPGCLPARSVFFWGSPKSSNFSRSAAQFAHGGNPAAFSFSHLSSHFNC
jgi:hypothetical protein